jgi:hypothetical protein
MTWIADCWEIDSNEHSKNAGNETDDLETLLQTRQPWPFRERIFKLRALTYGPSRFSASLNRERSDEFLLRRPAPLREHFRLAPRKSR